MNPYGEVSAVSAERENEWCLDHERRLVILEEWRKAKESANTRSGAWLIAMIPVAIGVGMTLLQLWLAWGRP